MTEEQFKTLIEKLDELTKAINNVASSTEGVANRIEDIATHL